MWVGACLFFVSFLTAFWMAKRVPKRRFLDVEMHQQFIPKFDSKKYIFFVIFWYQNTTKKYQKTKRKNDQNKTKFESSKSQKWLKNLRKNNKNQKMTSSYFVTKIQKKYIIFYSLLDHFLIVFQVWDLSLFWSFLVSKMYEK